MKLFFKKVNKLKQGYTIIETMIAVSLFLIIIMSGMGALLNANLLHQKSQSMRSIIDNLSFIMEDLSRNLRTGYTYRCITANPDLTPPNVDDPKSGSSCWGIAFESANGSASDNNDQWVYYVGPDTSLPGSPLAIWRSISGPYNNTSNFVKLTPDEVVIDPVSSFSVLGAEPLPDTQQPFVIIKLVGTITFKNVITPFSLQTSVSQRVLDI